MKLRKLSVLAIPLLFVTGAYAQALDVPNDFEEPGDTTFPLKDKFQKPQNLKPQEKQMDIQREEEPEIDSFGEDEYNQNVDPDAYKADEQINRQLKQR